MPSNPNGHNRTERILIGLLAAATQLEPTDVTMATELEELGLTNAENDRYDTFRRTVEFVFGVDQVEVGRWTRKVPLWQIRMWLEDRHVG